MPVQWVNRPDLDFRGFAGTVVGGTLRPGDRVRVARRARAARSRGIVTFDGDLERAVAGQSVTLTLADEIDVSRGDVIAAAEPAPQVADQFEAQVVWMAEEPMLAGRAYLSSSAPRPCRRDRAAAQVPAHVDTLEHVAATKLELNEIGVCNLDLDRPIAFDPYADNRDTGGFILIDRLTNATVGAGMLHFALRRSHNVHWQPLESTSRRALRR